LKKKRIKMKSTRRRPRGKTPTSTPPKCAPWCDFHDSESDTDVPGGICAGKPIEFDGGSVNLIRNERGTELTIDIDPDRGFRLADATVIGHILINTAGTGFAGGAR
jgi:hypothetical protein